MPLFWIFSALGLLILHKKGKITLPFLPPPTGAPQAPTPQPALSIAAPKPAPVQQYFAPTPIQAPVVQPTPPASTLAPGEVPAGSIQPAYPVMQTPPAPAEPVSPTAPVIMTLGINERGLMEQRWLPPGSKITIAPCPTGMTREHIKVDPGGRADPSVHPCKVSYYAGSTDIGTCWVRDSRTGVGKCVPLSAASPVISTFGVNESDAGGCGDPPLLPPGSNVTIAPCPTGQYRKPNMRACALVASIRSPEYDDKLKAGWIKDPRYGKGKCVSHDCPSGTAFIKGIQYNREQYQCRPTCPPGQYQLGNKSTSQGLPIYKCASELVIGPDERVPACKESNIPVRIMPCPPGQDRQWMKNPSFPGCETIGERTLDPRGNGSSCMRVSWVVDPKTSYAPVKAVLGANEAGPSVPGYLPPGSTITITPCPAGTQREYMALPANRPPPVKPGPNWVEDKRLGIGRCR